MSGRYSYGIDNPPTLRRSSFPQRVVRSVGVPKCKTRSGRTPRPPTLGCAGYKCCFSAGTEKQIRTARRCAPKVACGSIFIARALEREGRTTTPVPSSEEGNYSAGRLILFSLFPLSSANLVPAPSHRDPLASKAPTISQTRKLFIKFCVNSTLSLQIFLVSSGLVRGTSLTGKYLPRSDLCRRSLSSFAFPIFPRARLYARGISIQPKGGRRFVPCCPRGGGKNHLPFR